MDVSIVRVGAEGINELVNVLVKSYGISEELRDAAAESIMLHLEVEPMSCYEALLNGSAIGMACYVTYGNLAWVGFVGVVPEHRGKGVGTELMIKLINDLRGRGVKTFRLDATEAGERLYRKLGFKPEYRTLTLTRSSAGEALSNPLISEVRVADVMPPWAVAMDRRAFGAYRVKSISARLRRGGRLLVINGEGYALIYKDVVGPVVASRPEVAEALIHAAVSMGASKIVVPEANEEALRIVKSLQFKPVIKCLRMRLGEPVKESVNMIYGALSLDKG